MQGVTSKKTTIFINPDLPTKQLVLFIITKIDRNFMDTCYNQLPLPVVAIMVILYRSKGKIRSYEILR